MVRLPKIAIGTQKRKNHFDLTHDVTTTSDFGFCQPTIVRHLVPKSSSTLTTSVGVRLSALPVPTFGRIRLKTYNAFVPIQEVFEAFDYMQKKTSVTSVFGDYIPTSADFITYRHLLSFLIAQSVSEWSNMYSDGQYAQIESDGDCNAFFNFNVLCPSLKDSNIAWNYGQGVARFNDYTFVSPSSAFSSIDEFSYGNVDVENYHLLWDALRLNFEGNLIDFGSLNFLLPNSIYSVFSDAHYWTDCFSSQEMSISALMGLDDFKLSPVKRGFIANRGSESSYDFFLGQETLTVKKIVDGVENTLQIPIIFTLNWTKRGQRLNKILTACGCRGFSYLDEKVDLNKLYAYYKAWFDIMNPGRSRQWRETPCYRLIHTFYDDPTDIFTLMDRDTASHDGSAAGGAFRDFLIDLSDCCYVLPVDNITAATPQPLVNPGNTDGVDVAVSGEYNAHISSNSVGNAPSNYPVVLPGLHGANANGLVIDALLRLYKLANKNSVIGSRIEDYLRTKFGYSIERSNILQSSEMVVGIEEMYATTGSEYNYLGELGGRGRKDNVSSNKIKFEAPTFGIFVQFMCIVPFGDYVQGNVRGKFGRNDFYQEVYDSLGKEALSMSEVMSRSTVLSLDKSDSSFGFVPMEWRDKVINSMHNGAFALPSQRDVLLPYSLDRLFNEPYMKKTVINSNVQWSLVNGSIITPSEELRYIGRTPDFGSYDRIFYDNTGAQDNFILHILEQWDYYADMKAISQSFETYDDSNDDSSTTVTAS